MLSTPVQLLCRVHHVITDLEFDCDASVPVFDPLDWAVAIEHDPRSPPQSSQ